MENLKAKVLPFLKNKNKDVKTKQYNPSFLYKIQPAGGVKFEENYAKTGNGLETCIQIFDYPAHVQSFWLYDLLNMNNAITSIDIAPTEQSEIVNNINNSLREQLDRFYHEKDQTEKISAETKYQEITQIFNEISKAGESVKQMTIRIYISGRTTKEFEDKVNTVLQDLEGWGFKGTIFLNEIEYEWSALYKSSSEISKCPNKRVGKPIGANSLAAGYPFHFTKLNDNDGAYLGRTSTGGNVLFDLFHKDSTRKYYNGLFVGTMGSGKSTGLKKLYLDNAIRGNIIRVIDVTGEFENLTNKLGGKMISLDGTNGIINPLQILKTSEKESVSFMQHLSKITTFYKFLSPNAPDEIYKEFELLIRKLYIEFGIYDPDMPEGKLNLTGLKKEEYPIFSDLLELTRKELYSDLQRNIVKDSISENKEKRLESIELSIRSIVNNYGFLFNGTSSIDDITNQQIVCFSIRSLTQMKTEIFNAQMYNILNILWDNMLQNGTKYKDLFDRKKVRWEDIVRYLIIIDEAHRIINPDNIMAVKFLTNFEREARKYFAGLMYASQSIRSFVPEGTSSESANEIKTLFELTQYKFIMQQDADSLKTLRTVFAGSLSESELKKIPFLATGQVILAINSTGNIAFNLQASENELTLFQGGA